VLNSIDQNYSLPSLKVYPNPNNGKFYIENLSPIEEIKIYNLFGTEVYSSELPSGISELDLSHQLKGMLYVKIKTQDRVVIRNIIVQ
jgi:hypothetical protein